jgi:hypothetical protein
LRRTLIVLLYVWNQTSVIICGIFFLSFEDETKKTGKIHFYKKAKKASYRAMSFGFDQISTQSILPSHLVQIIALKTIFLTPAKNPSPQTKETDGLNFLMDNQNPEVYIV